VDSCRPFPLFLVVVAGPLVTVEKPELFFAEAFPNSGGNHIEKAAAGDHFRFPRLWQFPEASPFAAVGMNLENHE
jgi:hypothetical protein